MILRSQYCKIELSSPCPESIVAKSGRINVKLRSTESHHMYVTTKNPRTTPQRLEQRKYDPNVKRHVLYRESK